MAKIKVDSGKKLGEIKPMHAVGGAPMGAAEGFSAEFHYLTEAGIPSSRGYKNATTKPLSSDMYLTKGVCFR